MRILLVEDHQDTAIVLVRLLKQRYEVAMAGSCKEAIEQVTQSSFDAVLCDLGLPDGDGCDLLRELLKIRDIKAIALTGYGMDEDHVRIKDAGFIDHITKPFAIDALMKRLDDIGGKS